MSNFVANEVVGILKGYPLIKLLLKILPHILVSLYAGAVFISFSGLPWVKYTADGLGIKVISEALNLLGINVLVGPVNDFISWVKGGREIWISAVIIFVLISSANFYLQESIRYIKDYNPENEYNIIVHMMNPANPVYAFIFSFSAAIDWVKIIGFNWIFFLLLIVPLVMIVHTILSFVKSGKKDKSGFENKDNNKVPILLVLGEVFVPIFVSLFYVPVLLFLLFTGNIDAERSK